MPAPSGASQVALVFTDVVDSTLLVQRLGDERAAALWAEHDRQARILIARLDGREIDRSDGFLLLFADVAAAGEFARAYHAALEPLALSARVGVHVGTVTLRTNAAADVQRGAKPLEVEGLAKPFAARVMSLACGGQTLLSEPARTALLAGAPSLEAQLVCHGHYRLKGIAEPVALYELAGPGAAHPPPADGEKAHGVVRDGDGWRPRRDVPNNLDPERDAFVGRKAELAELAACLDSDARLVTLLGPGGTGKTRVARRYARAWLGDWPGGVSFCDLSEARTLDGLHFAVALALGVPLGKDDPGVQLGHAIASRGRCLLVLDNFEQLVDLAPVTIGRWLDQATEARFVVTSRARLHLAGEVVQPIEPLPLASDAIELFAVRARAQQPQFVLTEHNRAAVAEVVRLLDGLPLAIELAAARVRVLTPAQLVQRLEDRFQLLAGARGRHARQATLEAAIDWSWRLLDSWEQSALAQCSVFEGGFTLEAAEAVIDLAPWPDAPPVVDVVQSLLDRSLLRAWTTQATGRLDIEEPYFGMYLSIHDYAARKLAAAGASEQREAERRHGQRFAIDGSQDSIDGLLREGGTQRRRALTLELDNLVAACRRAVVRGDDVVATRCCVAAWHALEQQGPFAVAARLCEEVLAMPDLEATLRRDVLLTGATADWRMGNLVRSQHRLEEALEGARGAGAREQEGRARLSMGTLATLQGRVREARDHLEAAVEIGRATGQRVLEGTAVGSLGNLFEAVGEVQQAHAHFAAAMAIWREIGNRTGIGLVSLGQGALALNQGLFEQGRLLCEEALAATRETGNRRDESLALNNLANLCVNQGQLDEAEAKYRQALAIARDVGMRFFEGGFLGNLANLHESRGELEEARTLTLAALAIQRETGNRRSEATTLANLAGIEHQLGRTDAARGYLEQALELHRSVGNRRSEGIVLGKLGEFRLEQGRLEEARQLLDDAQRLLEEVHERFELVNLSCLRGHLHLAEGRRDAARQALDEAEAMARSIDAGPASETTAKLARLRSALDPS